MVASWALTIGFVGGGLCCLSGAARRGAGLVAWASAGALALMAATLIAMAWPVGTSLPVWPQVLVFALVAAWFLSLAVRERGLGWVSLHQALMAGGMVWMAATMQMGMMSPSVSSLDIVLGAYFAAAGLAFLAVALRGERLSLGVGGEVLMSLGMAALLLLRT